MPRIIRVIGGVAMLGALLIGLNLGGTWGCGGGGGSGSSTSPSGGGTESQQQEGLYLFKNASDVGTQIQLNLLAAALMVAGSMKNDATIACSGSAGGSYVFSAPDPVTRVLTFTNCDLGCSVVSGTATVVLASPTQFTTTFSVNATPDAGSGFAISGTSEFNAPNLIFNLTGAGSSSDAVVTMAGTTTLNSDNTANGSLVMSAGSSTIATCTLSSFNFVTGTMADFAASCGLSSPACTL